MSIFDSAPVMASKPVANTMLSNSYSASEVRMPFGVISTSDVLRTSTRCTFGLLNVA